MEESIAKRNHGKEARKALKSLHISGIMGQARVVENLRQENPGVEITRTQTWLATHTPKNGSARCEYRERVASLYEDNPSIANKDLDHNAVALILGRDNRGRVKGMGDGVSKTSIKYSDTYKKALQKEQESQVILQVQVDNLEKRLEVESWNRCLRPSLKQIHKCGLLSNVEAPLKYNAIDINSRFLLKAGTRVPADHSSYAPSGLSLMDGMALVFDQVDPWAPPVETVLGV
ncbi:hypothetical protein CKAN_00450600 [Cinnamomum micranthum f. kanehirae]|uniref:Uncharacterized protein n=1 Tax=Cinnamomum micranthum f. kanehirae TaxID=337451 RepID=A0A3S3MGQ5_9MAGN|nr:hypothetical protein CKAN_00450600 [Cinnamomum micranthum f. kanehirae]